MMVYKQLLPWVDEGVLEFNEFECSASFSEKMYKGVPINDEPSPKVFIKDPSKKIPDFLSGIGMVLPVTSVKATNFFKASSDAKFIQFIKPEIINYEKKDEFTILNILQVLDALDWDKSDYDLFDEPGPQGNKVIRKMRKLILKEDVINGRNIFYLKEFPAVVYISEKLENDMIKSGIKDFRTLPV
jgi:hypothetical protein